MANGNGQGCEKYGIGYSIRFLYSTNRPELTLEKILEDNPDFFAPAFNFTPKDDDIPPIAEIYIMDDPTIEPALHVTYTRKEDLPKAKRDRLTICLQGPIYDLQKEAMEKRQKGEEVLSLGSLIARTVYAAAIPLGNMYLQACGVIDDKTKTFYLIASDKDHAGKSVLVNELLRDGPEFKLVSTNQRIRIGDKKARVAYPQAYNKENPKELEVITLINNKEKDAFEKKTGQTLESLGYGKLEAKLGPEYAAYGISGIHIKSNLNQYNVAIIYVSNISADFMTEKPENGKEPAKQTPPKIYPLSVEQGIENLEACWMSKIKFGHRKLFGKIDATKFDDVFRKEFEKDVCKYATTFFETNKPDADNTFTPYIFSYVGNPYNAWRHLTVEMVKLDSIGVGGGGNTYKRLEEVDTPGHRELADHIKNEIIGKFVYKPLNDEPKKISPTQKSLTTFNTSDNEGVKEESASTETNTGTDTNQTQT